MNDALVPSQQKLVITPEELLSRELSLWEIRGRGWNLFDFPVELEPPFCPLYHLLDIPEPPVWDDGRKPTFLSEMLGGLNNSSSNQTANSSAVAAYRQEIDDYQSFINEANTPQFCQYYHSSFTELQLILPKDLKISKAAAENLLLSFSYLSHPAAFEVIGSRRQIVIQFACTEKDAPQIKQQIKSHLPNCFLKETTGYLTETWINGAPDNLIVDFGLSNEFMLPLKTASQFDADFLITIIGALSDLGEDEVGVFQVLFQKTRNDWTQEIIDSAEYFQEVRPYSKASANTYSAKEKVRFPLFAVCVRVGGRSFNQSKVWRIIKSIGAGLTHLASPTGNELIPLSNDDYREEYHEQVLLNRQSFRCGMILNCVELASIVHPPSNAVQSAKLQREIEQTKAAPSIALGNRLMIGTNTHNGNLLEVTLSEQQRTKHIHLIGSSGSGKSSLLLNLIKQDLETGQGLCVIDPHGDLIDAALENIPGNRICDVVLFDASDGEFPIGFNILQATGELEKTLLSSDLIATFRRMSTSWGDVMDSVLANAILAFVESKHGGTLFELKRFLIEKDFRREFLRSVEDEAVRYFWLNEFPLITGKPQSSILIRLDTFLRQKLIRNIVCQRENKINFREIMDRRKILLVKLSQGAIGEENSHLLGTLLVSKLYQTALSRQDTPNRPFFSCYLDEFHHFITPSMENVLSGVRKYNLGLVLAHQEFRQLQSRSAEVAAGVLSNCYTRICFRLGDTDAEKFAGGFSFFDAKALQNLGTGESIARVERADYDFNLKASLPPKVEKSVAEQRRLAVIRHSRENFGTPRAEVEANLFPIPEKPTISVIPPDKTTKPVISEVEVPKITGAQKQPIESTDDAESGHRYLQSIIKRIGENYGFVATLEKPVFGGIGKIDVALENDHFRIACEIAVTNTVQYELQNIQKCLASGFDKVVVISSNNKHLGNIRKTAESVISKSEMTKVHFLEPENFRLFFEALKGQFAAIETGETKIKGYSIKTDFKDASGSEAETRKQTVFDIIKGAIKRKGKQSKTNQQ